MYTKSWQSFLLLQLKFDQFTCVLGGVAEFYKKVYLLIIKIDIVSKFNASRSYILRDMRVQTDTKIAILWLAGINKKFQIFTKFQNTHKNATLLIP